MASGIGGGAAPIDLLVEEDRPRFADRRDAGRCLATVLCALRHENPIVVGIARDGMPVAAEVARALGAPLEVVVVSRIATPTRPEHPIGALADDGRQIIDDEA